MEKWKSQTQGFPLSHSLFYYCLSLKQELSTLLRTGTFYFALTRAGRPGRAIQRVNVDFPVDLLRAIDREAKRVGVTRQAFIKLRIADTLAPSQ